MSIATGLAKEMNCKVQDVKAIAKRLNIDIETIQPEQNEGLSEAIELFLLGKTIEEACSIVLDKAKGAIAVTQPEAIAKQGVSANWQNAPMPDGLKDRLSSISSHQAVAGVPKAKQAIAETLNGVSQETLEAITGYAAHSYQQALMEELNKPEFLDDLEKTIAAGKSQT